MFKKVLLVFLVLTLAVSGTGYLLANTASAMSPAANFAAPGGGKKDGGKKKKGGKDGNESSNLLDQPSSSNCNGKKGTSCCTGVKTSINYECKAGSGKFGHNPIFSLLVAIINFLAIGVGVAVVIGIIIGAYKFMTAQGNTNQIVQAKNTIGNSILALFLFAFMWALLNFLIPGGVFKG